MLLNLKYRKVMVSACGIAAIANGMLVSAANCAEHGQCDGPKTDKRPGSH